MSQQKPKRTAPKTQQPTQQLQRTSVAAPAPAPTQKTRHTESASQQAMKTLGKVAPQMATQGAASYNKMVATESAEQITKAFSGEAMTEGVSQGAKEAYDYTTMSVEAGKIHGALKQDAQRFEGTKEEWDAHVTAQAGTFAEQFAGNDKYAEVAASIFNQGIPGVMGTRGATQLKQDLQERVETNVEFLHDKMLLPSGELMPPEQMTSVIKGWSENNAMAQELTNAERDAVLMTLATTNAVMKNDTGMMQYLKDEGIFAKNPQLAQVEKAATQRQRTDNIDMIDTAKQETQTWMMKNPNATFPEFLQYANTHVQPNGESIWREGERRQFFQTASRSSGAAASEMNWLQIGKNAVANPDSKKLGSYDLTKKQRKSVLDKLDAELQVSYQQAKASGATDEELQGLLQHQKQGKMKFLLENAILDPRLQARIGSMMKYDTSKSANGEVSEDKTALLQELGELEQSPYLLEQHLGSPENVSIYYQIKNNLANQFTPADAIATAKTTRGTLNIGESDLEDIAKLEIAEDLYNTGWNTIFGTDVNESQLRNIDVEIRKHVSALVANNVDIDTAEEIARDTYEKTHFQTVDGTVVAGSRSEIANAMTYLNEDGDPVKFTGADVDDLIKFIPSMITQLESEGVLVLDTETPSDEWIILPSKAGVVNIKDPETGKNVVSNLSLQGLGRGLVSTREKILSGLLNADGLSAVTSEEEDMEAALQYGSGGL